MIPFGTYDLAAFPWLKRLSFVALLVNALCFALMVAREIRARRRLKGPPL